MACARWTPRTLQNVGSGPVRWSLRSLSHERLQKMTDLWPVQRGFVYYRSARQLCLPHAARPFCFDAGVLVLFFSQPNLYLFTLLQSVFVILTFTFSLQCTYYSVSKKNPPWGLVVIFPKRLGIFQPNFTCLLCVPIYASLRIFIQLPATLTKLSHIKRDHPVHNMCAKCPPSAEKHAGIFWHFRNS